MAQLIDLTTAEMLLRLLVAAVLGGLIGYERRLHNNAIGVAGMIWWRLAVPVTCS